MRYKCESTFDKIRIDFSSEFDKFSFSSIKGANQVKIYLKAFIPKKVFFGDSIEIMV